MRQQGHWVIPGRAEIGGLQLLESCSFHWIFDAGARQFRRTPRDARVSFDPREAWTAYHRLKIDDTRSCFVVALDEAGTRILRAWLHTDPCDRCERDRMATVDLQDRILWWKEQLRVRDPRFAGRPGGNPLRPFGGRLSPEGAL